ncbi:heparinase II/III family protein [Isoptericola sp. BMS4]|uniref:heparinase II/III family protein n=1 Tax=Isoptericola sp. BMS4 TaxID=2527875 RepID=UPI00142243AB|nr:heparinase II/III family protein [Isoptericola sp. BMS4]
MDTDAPFTGPLAAALEPALPAGREARTAALADLLRSPGSALPVPPTDAGTLWGPGGDLAADPAARPVLDALVGAATADLGTPWPHPLASTAAALHRDGDRTAHEDLVFSRQHRLTRAAVAAAVTGEERLVDEVADGVWQLCEQSTWCWPAHDDARATRGWVLPSVTDPYLDLGAGEAVGQLAWLDHLLGTRLDERWPGLRARIRHEARLRVVEPFLRRRDWHWLGLDGHVHNWSPWIHGNVLVAALRLLDGDDEAATRARVVALAVEGLDRYVAALPTDGAIDEGVAYWWNGACRALEALDVLAHATGGALDALDPRVAPPALTATVAFPHRMHLGGDWYVNLADAQARLARPHPWRALHRAAVRLGDADAAAYAASRVGPGGPLAHAEDGLGRTLRALADDAWRRDATGPADPPLPGRTWLASTQVLVARERPGTSAGLALAVKGGHNGEAHNHDDVGSVVVASDGVPTVVDAGRPTYTARTFGPDRYDIWCMQSSWHSVPEVAGTPQGAGRGFGARDVVPTLPAGEEQAAGLALDLAGAYPVAGLRRWRRDARLAPGVEGGAGWVVVTDEWDWADDGPGGGRAPTTVRWLLAGTVELGPGHARVRPLDGATPLLLSWPSGVRATLVDRELDDPMHTEVWGSRLTRLDLDVTGLRAVRLEVTPDPDGTPPGATRPATQEADTP